MRAAEGRINYHLIEIEIVKSNCFSRILTKIYFKQLFPIISQRIKLWALKRLQGLNLKLKLCARTHQS